MYSPDRSDLRLVSIVVLDPTLKHIDFGFKRSVVRHRVTDLHILGLSPTHD